MRTARGVALWPLIAVLAAGVALWNGSRFIGTVPRPRTKELDFLPSPAVARALSFGQRTAVAKLRWIDSFAYFQLQLDRQDDRVAGSDARGGFQRLYDSLISLDPFYLPFYQHVVTNTSGVLGQHNVALGFLLRGLQEMPGNTDLWRLATVELAFGLSWTKLNPAGLECWLQTWEQAEASEEGRQMVRDWRRGLAIRSAEGLETLPYWLEQMRSTKQGSPLGNFIEGTVRELFAQHGTLVLPRILAPGPGLVPDPAAIAAQWPHGVPAWAPVTADGKLRPDPYGWPWRRSDKAVISPGVRQFRFLKQAQGLRVAIRDLADKQGRPPRDAAEAAAWGVTLPEPPDGGVWDFSDRMPDVRWPPPPQEPWKLR